MKRLIIDIETRSPLDLSTVGSIKYASQAEVLCSAWKWLDEDDVHSCYGLPPQDAIDKADEVWAFNASFEYAVLRQQMHLPLGKLRCAMILLAFYGHGITSLKQAAPAFADCEKMEEGRNLIKYFAAVDERGRFINSRESDDADPDMRQAMESLFDANLRQLKEYCENDVLVTGRVLEQFPLEFSWAQTLWHYYHVDQIINTRGFPVDVEFATACDKAFEELKQRAGDEFTTLTGIRSVKCHAQIKKWLLDRGMHVLSTDQHFRAELLQAEGIDPDIYRAVELMDMCSGTASNKYRTLIDYALDGRVYGNFQYYGAHSGRWSGRGVQPHNFSRGSVSPEEVGRLRELIRTNSITPTQKELTACVRSAIAPAAGVLTIGDYTSIEAIVAAWVAGESWVVKAYTEGKDLYQAVGAAISGKPFEECGKGTEERFRGKTAVLGCGYGCSSAALERMNRGTAPEKLAGIVEDWREANPNIVKYWRESEAAMRRVIQRGQASALGPCKFFPYTRGGMFYAGIRLPSGRSLLYPKAHIDVESNSIKYDGHRESTLWGGGIIFENIVQAIAADIIADALARAIAEGLPVIMHVHDEIVLEGSYLAKLTDIMTRPPTWFSCRIRAAVQEYPFYVKD